MSEKRIINAVVDPDTGNLIVRPEDHYILYNLLRSDVENEGEASNSTAYQYYEGELRDGEEDLDESMAVQYDEDDHEDDEEKVVEEDENLDPKKNPIRWSSNMTLFLITTYTNIKKVKKNITTKNLFKEVAECLNTKGYKVSAEQCNSKWKLLNSLYKKNLKKKEKTGEQPITWPYFDAMHEILYQKPEIKPPAEASSLQGYKKRIMDDIQEEGEVDKKKRSVKKSKQDVILEEMQEARREASARHQETTQQRGTFWKFSVTR
ncbi:putative uncharacterized protein DDB_G0270496 isoform X2 [Leptopilina heterotoma]|uniref:putative uncharacterized protein DDB_G0270496 isoform X2 n=1 Tax=Leptopilina heterotoma TaxID=63436 RepID=UPI001CA9C3AC|nr:putative uncharacterized protein DDB_G0270496 isoform X2 [Leptopilina heterotoma]